MIFTRRESAEKEKRIEEDVHDEEGEKKEEGEKDKSKESGTLKYISQDSHSSKLQQVLHLLLFID